VHRRDGKGKPVFTIKSGAECGLLEGKQYLKLAGIKCLPPADKNRRRWTKEYRGAFEELLWVALAPRKSHNPFSKSGGWREPEVWCGVKWKWGVEELTRSELQRVISSGSADARINRMCEQNGHTPPGTRTGFEKADEHGYGADESGGDLNPPTDAGRSKGVSGSRRGTGNSPQRVPWNP
jgi:hypothetical protein